MKDYSLPFGKSQLTLVLPDTLTVDRIVPRSTEPLENARISILDALEKPLSKSRFEDYINVGSVGIAINDRTRPLPEPNPLPLLLHYLETLGVTNEKITLFIGSGTHTPMTKEETQNLLGEEITRDYKIIAHDCDHSPLINLGTTSYGTPILINEAYYQCDLKMTIGNIEPHHFMGFSGGVKTAAIGLAGRDTITANHTMLVQEQTRSGLYYINPMRQDIEEIGKKAGIHFSLGSILDENKRLLHIFFGDPLNIMKAAVPRVKSIFGVEVSTPYDLVIASPGGAPKDINLYQAQKGLTHASRITKDEGWVILLASCPEGSGSTTYEDYVTQAESHQAILDEFRGGFFDIGPHKAFQIAREATRVNIVLVSNLSPDSVKQWKLTPSKPELLNQLIEWLIDQLPVDPRIAILPAACRTMTEVTHD